MKLTELRKKWSKVLEQREELAAKILSEGRAYSEEEEAEDGKLKAESDSLKSTIARLEDLEKDAEVRNSAIEKPIQATVTREEGMDDKGNCIVFRGLGEQLMEVAKVELGGGYRSAKLEQCQRIMRNATGLSEGQAQDGGFLVQSDSSTELVRRTYETAIIAPLCRKIGISSSSNSIKIPGIDESSRANGARMGGVQAYWENEAAQYDASKPKFRLMELVLKKLTGLCFVTDELLADTGALEQIITDGFAEEFAFKMDDVVLRGLGAGQPLGVFAKPDLLIAVAKESGQANDTINAMNLAKVESRLWARSLPNAVWLTNQSVLPQLRGLSISVGNNAYPVLLPATGFSGAMYETIFSRPVLKVEHAEALGDQADIGLYDFSQYLLIDKGSMQKSASVHVRFIYDEMAFKFTYRVDGQPVWSKALLPYRGTETQSPFVVLGPRKG